MATIETRPFRVASKSSVDLNFRLLKPDVPIEDLSQEWEYGQDVVVRVIARLKESFWEETETSGTEDLWITVTARCFSARSSWAESSKFKHINGEWLAEVTLMIDGDIAYERVDVDANVSGLGRTMSQDERFATHKRAKVWESKLQPLTLEPPVGFPTSALSFEESGRYSVPWMVDVEEDAEIEQSYTTTVRLYVNTDLAVGQKIVATSAPDDVFVAIQVDIWFAVVHGLWKISDSLSTRELEEIADRHPDSFVALGLQYASSLKLPIKEAMRMSHEQPLKFLAIARQSSKFMGRKASK